MVMLKPDPEVLGLDILAKVKWSRAAGLTAKAVLVPDLPEPDVAIVTPVPDLVITTLPVHTPLVNTDVAVGVTVPVESLMVFVLV